MTEATAAAVLADMQTEDTAAERTPALPGRAEIPRDPAPDHRDRMDNNDPEASKFSRTYESYGDNFDYETYDESWKPPGLLDAPDPRPGFVQRWVAVSIAGSPNAMNLSQRRAEKWRPRDPASVPGQTRPPTISHGEWVGCIGVQAMVLMERPTVVHEAHRARIHEATNRQMEVVKGDMYAEQRPGDRAKGISNIQDRSARRVSTGGPILPADDDD